MDSTFLPLYLEFSPLTMGTLGCQSGAKPLFLALEYGYGEYISWHPHSLHHQPLNSIYPASYVLSLREHHEIYAEGRNVAQVMSLNATTRRVAQSSMQHSNPAPLAPAWNVGSGIELREGIVELGGREQTILLPALLEISSPWILVRMVMRGTDSWVRANA